MSYEWFPKWRWLPHVAGIFSFVSTMFVGLVFYDTVRDDSGRINMQEGYATGWLNRDGYINVMYRRGFEIKESGEGEMIRKVVCTCPKGDIDEFDLPTIRRNFEEGTYPAINRYLETPIKGPIGSTCTLITYGRWTPRFGISSKTYQLDEIPFVVTDRTTPPMP